MSDTLINVRDRLRDHMGDWGAKRVVNSIRLDSIISTQMHAISGRLDKPRETEATVALVAGTYDYTLAGAINNLSSVRLNSTGKPIQFLPFAEFIAVYPQNSAIDQRGLPLHWTSYETAAQLTKLRVGPTPPVGVADSLKVHYGIVLTRLVADTDLIPFSTNALHALHLRTLAKVVAMMKDDELAEIGIDKRTSYADWMADADEAIAGENRRIASLGILQGSIARVEA